MATPRTAKLKRKPVKLKPVGEGDVINWYQLPEQAQALLNDVCEEMRLLALLTLPRTPEERRQPRPELSIPAEPLANCFTRAFLNLQNVLRQAKPMAEVGEDQTST